jgi:Nucleotide modification associated domain 2
MTLYSYVVEHDNGYAPNPYFGLCTLCRCKFGKRPEGKSNIVELAKEGDWVIGTGGASKRSAGHGKLVYAMLVDEKLTRAKYFSDSRFAQKKSVKTGTYKQTRGDNEPPRDDFEKHFQFALTSRHFYYFGANAIDIPKEFALEKKGPGFRSHFDPADVRRFVEWLERTYKPGKHGEPCYREPVDNPKGSKRCKSSC